MTRRSRTNAESRVSAIAETVESSSDRVESLRSSGGTEAASHGLVTGGATNQTAVAATVAARYVAASLHAHRSACCEPSDPSMPTRMRVTASPVAASGPSQREDA